MSQIIPSSVLLTDLIRGHRSKHFYYGVNIFCFSYQICEDGLCHADNASIILCASASLDSQMCACLFLRFVHQCPVLADRFLCHIASGYGVGVRVAVCMHVRVYIILCEYRQDSCFGRQVRGYIAWR